MTTQLLDTEIRFCRATRDYEILIADQVVGFAANYHDAERIRTQLLADRRDEGHYATATELDGDPPGPSGDDPSAPPDPDPAPGRAPDAGRAIYRQFHRDRYRFLTVLRALDPDAWRPLAEAYCAYLMRVGRPAIDPSHVLHIWAKAVSGDIRLPERAHPLLVQADASRESYAGL